MKTISLKKKVAAVAVASLGFGLLSVVPANAGGATPVISDPTDGYVATGSAYTASTTISYTGDNSADTGTLSASVSGPTGNTATTVTFGTATGVTANSTFTPGTGVLAQLTGANGSIAATVPLSFTPTIAGTYTITLTMTATTTATQSYTVRAAGLAYSLGDGAAVSPATTGNGIAGPANTVTVNATADAANNRSLVTVSGAGATINSNAGAALSAGVTSTIVAAGTNAAIIINTPQVGTITVSQFYESGNGTGIYSATASKTVTITVGAAAVNGTISVANSSSLLDGTIGADNQAWSSITADETAVVTAAASASVERAVIRVVLRDTLNNVMPDSTGVSAVITGPGLLSIGTTQQTTAVGRAVSSATLASGTGTVFISVYSDGTPGVGTITISQGTTVVATERVTFFGTATRYAATANIVAAADASTSTDVVTVCATDAAGIAVPGETIYAFSGDTTVATIPAGDASDATEVTAVAAFGTSVANHVAATAVGCVGFDITALSQTTKPSVVLTFGNATTIAASTVSTTATVLVGSVAATTVALSANKASYAPGEAVTLTLTFRDSAGRPVAHGPGTATLAAALTASSSLGTAALFGTANSSKTGTTVQTVYAPLSAGPVTVAGTTGADTTYLVATARGVALNTTFNVAQNADIAGITTAISALNARVVALNALIAKIMKRLNIR